MRCYWDSVCFTVDAIRYDPTASSSHLFTYPFKVGRGGTAKGKKL